MTFARTRESPFDCCNSAGRTPLIYAALVGSVPTALIPSTVVYHDDATLQCTADYDFEPRWSFYSAQMRPNAKLIQVWFPDSDCFVCWLLHCFSQAQRWFNQVNVHAQDNQAITSEKKDGAGSSSVPRRSSTVCFCKNQFLVGVWTTVIEFHHHFDGKIKTLNPPPASIWSLVKETWIHNLARARAHCPMPKTWTTMRSVKIRCGS